MGTRSKHHQKATVRKTAIALAIGLVALAPAAAKADPPAVGSPIIPPVFVGAPTNQDSGAGQFLVAFDATGRLVRIGRAPEPPRVIDATPGRARRQSSVAASPTVGEKRETTRQFVPFRRDLRELARRDG